MLTQDDIYRIIREQIENGAISKEFLLEYGIDVEEAIDIGLLKCEGDTYKVISEIEVKNYANKCAKAGAYDDMEKALEFYCEVSNNSIFALEHYFNCLLKNKKYEKAYEVFKRLVSLKSYNFRYEDELFMLLFSRVIDIPLEDLHTISYMQLSDALVPDDDGRFYDVKTINEARRNLFNGSEKKAISILASSIRSRLNNSPMALINMVDLAGGCIDAEKERNDKVKALIEEENYEEALLIYKSLAGKTIMKYKDDAIKHLLEALVLLKQGLPVINNDAYVRGFVFELILHDNFILAKQRNGLQPSITNSINPIVSTLLDKVVDSLTSVKEEVTIEDIKSAFALDDYNKLFRLLGIYLKNNKREKYYSYAVMLFAQDILTGENNAISFLEDPKSLIDITKIKSNFEKHFKERRYAASLVNYYMLDFVNREILPIDDLESYGERISHKRLGIDQNDDCTLMAISNAASVSLANLPLPRALNDNRDYVKYHRIFTEVINKKSFVIFKTANKHGFDDLMANAEVADQIKISTIIVGEEHICFVKYNMQEEAGNEEKYLIDGDNAYLGANYLRAIRYYKMALCLQNAFDLSLIVKLALCYLKLGDYKMAKEYFYVASSLCKVRQIPDIYASFVNNIKLGNLINSGEIDSIESTLNFDLVYEYVAKKVILDNVPFGDVLKTLNLPLARVYDLKLYYAEYAYILGNTSLGDDIINSILMGESEYYSFKATELFNRKDELQGSKDVPEYVRAFILK